MKEESEVRREMGRTEHFRLGQVKEKEGPGLAGMPSAFPMSE